MSRDKPTGLAINVKGHRVMSSEFWFELTGADLVKLLGVFIPEGASNVCVKVRVPGGGDWSNRTLEIDETTPLTVSWDIQSEEDLEATIAK